MAKEKLLANQQRDHRGQIQEKKREDGGAERGRNVDPEKAQLARERKDDKLDKGGQQAAGEPAE